MTCRHRYGYGSPGPQGTSPRPSTDTLTTQALAQALPLVSTARTWGEEVYFDTGVSVSRETDARQVVEPGTVTFWTDALALPYGPTPIPQGEECRPASPCNILGRIDGDPGLLATVRGGDPVRVELVDA